jgi:hypothetical protein
MAKTNSKDVFINCPFDSAYTKSFRALVFAVRACGFRARCALELDDAGETRLEKLYRLVEQSRYGIHDLSRTELDSVNHLPRFNMPLELGIFLGAKRFGGDDQKAKHVLILDIEKYRYQKFISDLAGVDIHNHGGNPRKAVTETRDWLANVSKRTTIPSQRDLLKAYDDFSKALPDLAKVAGYKVKDLQFADFERLLVSWLKLNFA